MSFYKGVGALVRRVAPGPYHAFHRYKDRLRRIRDAVAEGHAMRRGRFLPGSVNGEFASRLYRGAPNPRLAKGVVCMCDGRIDHGGPTDRLRGILTTYREARRRGLPFYISWTVPFDLTDYLVPATFDWRISPDRLGDSLDEVMPVVINDLPDLESGLRLNGALDCGRAQIQVYSNADNARGEYAQLYREVFRPAPQVQEEVDRHLAVLGTEYYAFTFRFLSLLGDFTDWDKTRLSDAEAQAFMRRVGEEFDRIAATLPADCRILLTADSRRFLDYMQTRDPRIYVVPGEVRNIALTPGVHRRAWLKTFVDQQLLMHGRHVWLLRTGGMYPSGFPRFAAEVGSIPFTDHHF